MIEDRTRPNRAEAPCAAAVEALEDRVRRLERANTRLWSVFGAAVTGAVLLAATGGPPPVAEEIVAERVRVVDSDGRTRIDLRHDSEETGVFVIDERGHTRVGAAQFAHGGSGYALHGPEGRGAAVLYLKGDGSLTFHGPEGGIQARFPEVQR